MKQYPLYAIDYFDTFDAFIEGIDAKFGPRRAVSYFTRKQVEVVHTYHELCAEVRAIRESLRIRGLVGKHIAIISENSYEWLVAYLAITSSGSVAVCIDAEQSDETIHQMLEMADVFRFGRIRRCSGCSFQQPIRRPRPSCNLLKLRFQMESKMYAKLFRIHQKIRKFACTFNIFSGGTDGILYRL